MENVSDLIINNEKFNTSDDGSENSNIQEIQEIQEIQDNTLLSLDDIIINLKIISKIKENDKMIVNNKTMTVDSRNLLSIRRWWSSDNREITIEYISKVLNQTFNHLTKNNDINVKQELKNALAGLDNLRSTYRLDNVISSKIDILVDKINKTVRLNN